MQQNTQAALYVVSVLSLRNFTRTANVNKSAICLMHVTASHWQYHKIKALFVVSIYIYHIFIYESLTSNSSVALPTIVIFE